MTGKIITSVILIPRDGIRTRHDDIYIIIPVQVVCSAESRNKMPSVALPAVS